jgi:hypothetical protein
MERGYVNMALVKHGITAETPSNILLGAGAWFKGLKYEEGAGWAGTVLGATSGGSSVKIVPEVMDIEVDGAVALAKGLAVMQGGTGEVEVNFAEITSDILKMTTLGEVLDSTSEHYVEGFDCIQTKNAIVEGDYVENLGFVGYTADQSKQIIVIVDYALCKSGFQIDPKNKENAVIKATFTAYGDISTDLDRVPIRIYYPTESAA